MSKDVAKKGATDVAIPDYGEHAGKGYEHQTAADVQIPFLSVLQALSPQVEDLPGAKPGMLFNTVTEELFDGDEGVLFVPATSRRKFVEWVPRKSGGGFVGLHDPNSEIVKRAIEEAEEFGAYKTSDGNDLVDTFYLYGVLVDEQDPISLIVLAFYSTKIKVYRKLTTRLRNFKPNLQIPRYAHLNRVTTFKDSNNKGEFYNLAIRAALPDGKGNPSTAESLLSTDDPRFQAAFECYEMVEKGLAEAAYDSQQKTGEGGDEDIPF